MDTDSLTHLLRGEHINVPDRIAKGIWPHPPLSYDDVCTHLIDLLLNNEWFPSDLSMGREGVTVQNTNGKFVCHIVQYNAWGYPIFSERSQKIFTSAREAADFYLKWDLHLPGDLDSWKVV